VQSGLPNGAKRHAPREKRQEGHGRRASDEHRADRPGDHPLLRRDAAGDL